MIDKVKLKDKMGRWKTQALFVEYPQTGHVPVYTLKDYDFTKDGVKYPSLKTIYLSYNDPTEYTFVTENLGSWEHWQKICNNQVLLPYILKWREELEIKIRSQAIQAMVKTATTEGSKGTAAAKYIADKGWKAKKKGAPTKEEIEGERKVQAGITTELDNDAERINIKH